MEILESNQNIRDQIIRALAKKIGKRLARSHLNIETKIRVLVREHIINSPEYQSILDGELRQHFGLIRPSYALGNILKAFDDGISVTYMPGGLGGLNVTLAKDGFENILEAPGASYYSGEYEITWLYWMLNKGTEKVVQEYGIVFYEEYQKTSRAGLALMALDGGYHGESNWGVPEEFSGTPEDNWFTRALAPVKDYINRILNEEVARA